MGMSVCVLVCGGYLGGLMGVQGDGGGAVPMLKQTEEDIYNLHF